MQFIDGVSGKLLTEEHALLDSNAKTIVLDGDAYQIMRSLLKIASGDDYVDNSSQTSEGGVMCFYTDQEYEQTKNILKTMGLPYEDTPINNAGKNKHNRSDSTPSPYPSNSGVRKNRTY